MATMTATEMIPAIGANVAHAFAALLDIYAMPNHENPDGMADDKNAFRKHFALIIEEGAQ